MSNPLDAIRLVHHAGILLCLLVTVPGHAQQNVALVHGFASSGDTWLDAEQRLVQEFGSRIIPYRPNLPDHSGYDAQGVVLATATASWPNGAVFVGHSNGGIASRMSSKYSGKEYRGIVTVGTPHGGAPVFANIGAVSGLLLVTAADMALPITRYSNGGDWQTFMVWIEAVTYTGLLQGATNLLVDEYANIVAGTLRAQITPGSAFNQMLNSDTALTREAQQMPGTRVGIASVVPQIGGYLCGLQFEQSACAYAQYTLADLYYATYLYYLTYYDPYDPNSIWMRQYAYEWVFGSMALYNLDDAYCVLYTGQTHNCIGDLLVPLWSQTYPGATQYIVSNGPRHTKETTSDLIYQQIVTRFRSGGVMEIP